MKHLVGIDEITLKKTGNRVPVVVDTDRLLNGHMLFAGMSGSGKSYQMMSFLQSAGSQGLQVDVFDPHDELHEIPGAAVVRFSQATRAGFNPLVLNPDIHSGGVRNQIKFILRLINQTSSKLGPRQAAALSYLLEDVYRARGCFPENAASWVKEELTERQFDDLTRDNKWAELRRYYPILRDVISYTERQLAAMTTGSDMRSANALERVQKTATRFSSLNKKFRAASTEDEAKAIRTQLEAEKEKAKDYYCEFVESIETGREMQDIHRYSDAATLRSVLERLVGLQNGGIFCSNPPNWNGSNVRVYQIMSIVDHEEQRMLVHLRANDILRRCQDMGKTDRLRHIIAVDEGNRFMDNEDDNPLNRIAKEGRKFGLGLMIGSQSPTHFSEDFVTNTGTVVFTGLHTNFWKGTCEKMQIDRTILEATQHKQVISMKMHRDGEASAKFVCVNVVQANVQEVLARARQAAQQRAAA